MPELKVIQPRSPEKAPPAGSWWKPWATRLYRLGVVVAIVWMVHDLHARLRFEGEAPIELQEVRPFFPAAQRLERDDSPRRGLFVLGGAGERLGYVLRTAPESNRFTGYVGTTDTLVALDPEMKVVGIRIRSSQDTKEHVGDVRNDEYFMTLWNGKTWDQVAGEEPQEAGVEGVSGSSLTSLAIADGIYYRFKSATEQAAAAPPPVRFRANDIGLIAVLVVAMLFAFTNLKSRTWARRLFQVVLIGYVGFVNGEILAQSLFSGWSASSVPWRAMPGLTLLVAAALIVPWATRRQVYCSHICPHGAAQEWAGRLTKQRLPKRVDRALRRLPLMPIVLGWAGRLGGRQLKVPKSLDRGLRWLPALLIAVVLFVTVFQLPFDLAGIEPFNAYVGFIAAVGWATVAIAVVGLIVAIFVPMAYCKYGCPTGLLLSFVRSHGKADGFGRRDLAAGLMVLFVFGMTHWYQPIHRTIYGDPPVFRQPSINIKGAEEEAW